MALQGDEWVPAKDVEMKIGISRMGGIISVGDEETYTTDSAGTATAEFKKDKLIKIMWMWVTRNKEMKTEFDESWR